MECNQLCSLCSSSPPEHFCICSNLPVFCSACRAVHEAKPGFHFPLPIAGLPFVTPQNQPQYRLWFVCLTNSQEKLRENMQEIEKCEAEIEAQFTHIQAELTRTKDKLMQTLAEIKAILQAEIEEAIQETTFNSYLGNYQPSSLLASLVWTHGCENSFLPISVFSYAIQPRLEVLPEVLSVSFQSPLPEIANLGMKKRNPTNFRPEIDTLYTELQDKTHKEDLFTARDRQLVATQLFPIEFTLKTEGIQHIAIEQPTKTQVLQGDKAEKMKCGPCATPPMKRKRELTEKSDIFSSKRDIFMVTRVIKEEIKRI